MPMNQQELDKALEQVKKDVFLGNNAAFLGSLLCSHEFLWDHTGETTQTACTDSVRIWWSVLDFERCSKDERNATLLHELWHTGLLHGPRRGSRCPDIWNVACDYRINNNLIRDGHKLPKNGYWVFDLSLDDKGIMAEEEIYELLMKNALPMPQQPMNDMKGSSNNQSGQQHNQSIAAVVRALQAAEISGQAGKLPGNLREIIKGVLQPKIPWRTVLMQWMTDLLDEDYTWRLPNRRYRHMYLPSREEDDGRLEHLVYFQDTSGSISKKDLERFNSEVKYVQETLQPKKLTLVQFDTVIQYTREFSEGELFEEITMHGGGGTSLEPVREWIEKNQPTAAIVFSDLDCAPMQNLTRPVPVIWAAIRNKSAHVPFGQLIHITD